MKARTLAWPSQRNSFHAAWLLLLVPGLLQLCVAASSPLVGMPLPMVAQFVLALAFVAPWIWWRSGTAPAAAVQWMKEIRGQMPGLLVATLPPAVAGFAGDSATALFWGYPIGCLLMGSSIFATEFENRTLPALLGQPRSRAAVYRRKHAVLAALLAFATANLILSALANSAMRFALPTDFLEACAYIFGSALIVFATAPLYALLTRTTIAGATFTVAVPVGGAAILGGSIQLYCRLRDVDEPTGPQTAAIVAAAAAVYAIGAAFLGWRTFSRLDATDGAQAIAGTGLMSLGKPAARAAAFLGKGPIGYLVRKELRLQSIPWVTALLMLGIAILAGGARALGLPAWESGIGEVAIGFMGMTAVVCVLGTGAACVAEERQLGTHDWQLTQPATLLRQWWVKLAVTAGVALLVGCVWPVLLARVVLGGVAFGKLLDGTQPWAFAAYLGAVLMLLAVSILASSLSRTTLKAGVAAIAATFAVATFIAFVIDAFDRLTVGTWSGILPQPVPPPDPGWVPTGAQAIGITLWTIGVAGVAWLATLLELARRNHRRSSVPSGGVARYWLAVAATTVLVIFIPVGTASLLGRRMAAAERADAVNAQWDQLETIVRRELAAGTLPPGVREAAGTGTTASPREIAAGLLREHGDDAFRMVTPPPQAGPNPGQFRMDPSLMKRYGLIPRGLTPPAANDAAPTPKPPAMDPALLKRYGLDAAPAKPQPEQ